MSDLHHPVLLEEAIAALNVKSDGVYIDATYGRGGHSRAILDRLDEHGRLLALDRDPAAAADAQQRFARDTRFCFVQTPFSRLQEVVVAQQLAIQIDGILLDLGVSSPQLDDPSRGFSFRGEGPLDMRMDPTVGVSATQWLSSVDETELASVLRTLGEERFHRRVARAIVAARLQAPITTTRQLAAIVAAAVPTRERGQHPATRSFQAIRIALNRELEELRATLEQAVQVLKHSGRLVVISFHSLEDRIVKRFLREQARGPQLPPDLPVLAAALRPSMRIIGKPVRVSEAEAAANPRARSAIMRIAEQLA